MSAPIGAGDWVQSVVTSGVEPGWWPRIQITAGAIYQVTEVVPREDPCPTAAGCTAGLKLAGQPICRDSDGVDGSWCLCAFRKWPGPADEALRSERDPYKVEEPA